MRGASLEQHRMRHFSAQVLCDASGDAETAPQSAHRSPRNNARDTVFSSAELRAATLPVAADKRKNIGCAVSGALSCVHTSFSLRSGLVQRFRDLLVTMLNVSFAQAMSGIFKFLAALLVLIPVGVAGSAAHAEKRIALVIGNADYQ